MTLKTVSCNTLLYAVTDVVTAVTFSLLGSGAIFSFDMNIA